MYQSTYWPIYWPSVGQVSVESWSSVNRQYSTDKSWDEVGNKILQAVPILQWLNTNRLLKLDQQFTDTLQTSYWHYCDWVLGDQSTMSDIWLICLINSWVMIHSTNTQPSLDQHSANIFTNISTNTQPIHIDWYVNQQVTNMSTDTSVDIPYKSAVTGTT